MIGRARHHRRYWRVADYANLVYKVALVHLPRWHYIVRVVPELCTLRKRTVFYSVVIKYSGLLLVSKLWQHRQCILLVVLSWSTSFDLCKRCS
jgi:hypothetical protein